jgi:hypothetical protein
MVTRKKAVPSGQAALRSWRTTSHFSRSRSAAATTEVRSSCSWRLSRRHEAPGIRASGWPLQNHRGASNSASRDLSVGRRRIRRWQSTSDPARMCDRASRHSHRALAAVALGWARRPLHAIEHDRLSRSSTLVNGHQDREPGHRRRGSRARACRDVAARAPQQAASSTGARNRARRGRHLDRASARPPRRGAVRCRQRRRRQPRAGCRRADHREGATPAQQGRSRSDEVARRGVHHPGPSFWARSILVLSST